MKVPGYCTVCRRVKRVRVTTNGIAVAVVSNGPIQGICDDCENPPKPKGARP